MPALPLIGKGNNRVAQNVEIGELQQTNSTNPWKEIERTVRTVDEERVKDCTEDIDTLLVFAGLYSAVLTAFLIESYKSLQADPAQDYLRQIALQTSSYTFNNGTLNATFSLSQFPPFQAAKSDIRINVCWFASLMLSLSSASFGILVKQWLREFLAFSYISPQERIRIRNTRVQGLESWKLFEIASFLPVLLQISLALFFVGLCFFTAGVHSSIGTTSLFLVICWAFFFLLSIMAPLVSSRCPYKTTSLKVAFRHARPHVQSLIRILQRRLTTGWLANFTGTIISTLSWLSKIASKLVPNPHEPTAPEGRETAVNDNLPANIAADDVDLEDYINRPILQKLFLFNTETASSVNADQFPHGEGDSLGVSLGEEDELRSVPHNDLVIFRSIDTSFFDDTLLTAMQKALQRQPYPLRQALLFVMSVFESRLGFRPLDDSTDIRSMVRTAWPWTLSRTARTTLMSILADGMDHVLCEGSRLDWEILLRRSSEWTISFAFIVSLSTLGDTIPSSVLRLFQRIVRSHMEGPRGYSPLDVFSYQTRILAQCDPRWPVRSLLFLSQCLAALKPEEAASVLCDVAHVTFLNIQEYSTSSTYHVLLQRDPNDEDGNVIAPMPLRIVALLECTRVILHTVALEQTQGQDEFPQPISQLLEFVFDAIPAVKKSLSKIDFNKPLIPESDGSSTGLFQVLTDLFTTPSTIHSLLDYFIKHPGRLHIPTDTSRNAGELFSFLHLAGALRLSQDKNIAILSSCTSFFEKTATQLGKIEHAVLLRLCYLIFGLTTDVRGETCVHWHRMYTAAATCAEEIVYNGQSCYDISCPGKHEEACNMAFVLLTWIHARHNDGHERPKEQSIPGVLACSQVPDEMIDVLRRSVCSRHVVDPETEKTFWRIKWLEDLISKTTGQDTPDHSTISRPSPSRRDSNSSDESVNAAVDSRPAPSAPTTNSSPFPIASVTESRAHLDDSVGPAVAELDEQDQPYVSVAVTDPMPVPNLGSADDYRLRSAETTVGGPRTMHPSCNLGASTAQTSTMELEFALPSSSRPDGNVPAAISGGTADTSEVTSPIATDSSPWPPTAFEVFSVAVPAVVPADERPGLPAETSPENLSAPVVQSMRGEETLGVPIESISIGISSSSELSNTTNGS